MWQRYLNRSGNSGVTAYEIGEDYIWVEFVGGARYLYTRCGVGSNRLAAMQELALDGQGLSSFIGRHQDLPFDRNID